jgi:hypothetical protein
MPNPSISQFMPVNLREAANVVTTAGMVSGGITGYFRYVPPVFSGDQGASINDPGGLFGWLIYSRNALLASPRGTTADTYILYDNPRSLLADMNRLGGITYCLVSTPTQGGTFGFFLNTSGAISGKTFATDFLHAINYLAYGGQLVLAGTTQGLSNYVLDTNTNINVLIGNTANAQIVNWLKQKPYTIGIFPSGSDVTNQIGAGYTMQNFTSLVGITLATTGSTFSNRVFNVCGVKGVYSITTDLLAPNSSVTAYYLPAIADVAGFYQVASDSNTVLNTLAGIDTSTLLNGTILNPVEWSNADLKTTLRNNRVNYFLNGTNKFLGQDLMGATLNSATPTTPERFGPSALQIQVNKDVSDIALKYLFKVNNAVSRSQVVTEIQAYLNGLVNFIDITGSEVICDESNGNVDNSTTLYITVVVKPIISSSEFVVDVTVTA